MMKKAILAAAAILTFCSVSLAQSRTDRVEYQESSARNLEPQQSVMITPMIADLQLISDKIAYTEKDAFSRYPVSPAIVKLVPEFKKIALSRAARAYKADAIVGATIDVITNEAGFLEITVSGYPAKYVNFRNATEQDVNLVAKAKSVTGEENNKILENPEGQTRLQIEK